MCYLVLGAVLLTKVNSYTQYSIWGRDLSITLARSIHREEQDNRKSTLKYTYLPYFVWAEHCLYY